MGSLHADVLEGWLDFPFRPEVVRPGNTEFRVQECARGRPLFRRRRCSRQWKGSAQQVVEFLTASGTCLGSERERPDDDPVIVWPVPRLSGILQVSIGSVVATLDQYRHSPESGRRF